MCYNCGIWYKTIWGCLSWNKDDSTWCKRQNQGKAEDCYDKKGRSYPFKIFSSDTYLFFFILHILTTILRLATFHSTTNRKLNSTYQPQELPPNLLRVIKDEFENTYASRPGQEMIALFFFESPPFYDFAFLSVVLHSYYRVVNMT